MRLRSRARAKGLTRRNESSASERLSTTRGPRLPRRFLNGTQVPLDVDEMAAGPRMFFEMKRIIPAFGGEALWLGRKKGGCRRLRLQMGEK